MLQGKPKAEYVGVAKFLTYLVEHAGAGQVAPGDRLRADHLAAAKITEEAGFYKKNPGRDVAVKQLTLNPPTENSKGLRIGNFPQIRDVVDEELESVWSGKKDAKTALDEAVKRGNEQLRKFEAAEQVERPRASSPLALGTSPVCTGEAPDGRRGKAARRAMEKRVTFNERLLPYLLVAPQMIVTLVFFFWPSGQMLCQSMVTEDAFGGNTKFVWFENFATCFSDPATTASARLTAGVQRPGGGDRARASRCCWR